MSGDRRPAIKKERADDGCHDQSAHRDRRSDGGPPLRGQRPLALLELDRHHARHRLDIGRIDLAKLLAEYGSDVVALMRMTKQAWDPKSILNPGKIVA